MKIRSSIIPADHTFAQVRKTRGYNLKAICIFASTGFFMDDDTFWLNEVCLRPGCDHIVDEDGYLVSSQPWFQWHYSPEQK
ncbi:MAG: asparagine synthetase B family protein, partial [Flavobacteriaceae bacterium]|nr:asparagine synthetase B family protein [Flavobacteriaceae bacterium]